MASISSTDISNPMVVKLSQVCQIINGFFFRKLKDSEVEKKIPYIKSADIKSKTITKAHSFLAESQVKSKNITAVAKGSLLIGLTGLGIGQIATLDIDAIIDPTVCAVVNNWIEALDTAYLYYFLLNSIPFLTHSTKTSTRVNSLLLRDLEINVLPIAQQKNIVTQIEQKIETFNAEIQVLEQGITHLERNKQAFLNNAYASLADTFKTTMPLHSIATVQAGNTPTESMKVYYGNTYQFFKPEDTNQGTNMLQSKTQLSARGAIVTKLIPPNSLLLACAGPLTGKVGITQIEATCSKSMMAIIPSTQVTTKFLYYQFSTDYIQQQIKDNSVLTIIIKSKIEALNFYIIPLVNQLLIVEKIDAYFYKFEKEMLVMGQRKDALISEKIAFLSAIFQKNDLAIFKRHSR